MHRIGTRVVAMSRRARGEHLVLDGSEQRVTGGVDLTHVGERVGKVHCHDTCAGADVGAAVGPGSLAKLAGSPMGPLRFAPHQCLHHVDGLDE